MFFAGVSANKLSRLRACCRKKSYGGQIEDKKRNHGYTLRLSSAIFVTFLGRFHDIDGEIEESKGRLKAERSHYDLQIVTASTKNILNILTKISSQFVLKLRRR